MDLKFDTPVPIIIGLGYPATVDGVMAACSFLDDWPAWRRDKSYSLALKACKAALAGEVEPSTTRTAFLAFARRHDLLAYEDEPAAAVAPALANPAVSR
jgi:Protein of unknown function (DUF982).